MSQEQITTLINRLETVTARLETVAQKSAIHTTSLIYFLFALFFYYINNLLQQKPLRRIILSKSKVEGRKTRALFHLHVFVDC